jgi:hypothetical protein
MDPQVLTDEKIAALAEDPRNQVYRYVSRERLPQAVPLDDVQQLVTNCWQRFNELRTAALAKNPVMSKKAFVRIRDTMNHEFKSFSYTHPLIFDRIVNPETTPVHIETLLYMINLRRNDPTEAGRTQLAKRVMDTFAVSREEWEATHGPMRAVNVPSPFLEKPADS